MANPSLQIGNSNWAIKEDNLLGYSTAGTRFLPQPITMTRASAGTRVNPQGLVETVELLGSELVTDGDFPTGTTAWIRQSNWTIGGGKATVTLGNNGDDMLQDIGIVSGKTYKIEVTISNWSAGSLRMNLLGTGGDIGDFSADGTYVGYAIGGNDSRLQIAAKTTTTTLSIDNVSVKESTKNNLARVDYDGTASSLLVEPERKNEVTYSEDLSVLQKVSIGTASAPVTTSNYAIAPDGTQTATRVVFNLNGGTSIGDRSILRQAIPIGSNYYFSIYVKSTDGTEQKVMWHDGGEFNLTTVTNEWVRITYDANVGISYAGIALKGGQGVDSSDILTWGFQVEVGSYPTSYIPTSGSTVTRVKDQYEKTGISNLIGQTEGVIYVKSNNLFPSGTRSIAFAYTSGSSFYQIYLTSNNEIRIDVNGSLLMLSNIIDLNILNKIAFAYKSGDNVLYVNGVPLATSTSTTIPSSLNDFYLGNLLGNEQSGSYQDCKIYKTRLSNPELATLTTI